MAPLQSIILRNYRRFRGEIEFSLSSGINLIQTLPGMGKSSIAEAVAWCLVGRRCGPTAAEVVNVDAGGAGDEDVLVSLSFQTDEEIILERSLTMAGTGMDERTAVHANGKTDGEFTQQREALFPAACIHSNIISGASIGRVLQSERMGTERAVADMPGWNDGDAPLRASMEATSLYVSMVPNPSASCLLFNEHGQPLVQCSRAEPMGSTEHRLMILSAALAFARESCPGIPIILDEPFLGLDDATMERAVKVVTEFMDGHQVIFLLSRPSEIEAVRAIDHLEKEIEVRG